MTRFGVRVAFAVALLSLPVWLVVRSEFGEPYPGLYQPRFGSVPLVDGEVWATMARVTVFRADGSTVEVDQDAVLPAEGMEPRALFSSAFADPAVARDTRLARWLAERFADLGEESPLTTVEIAWEKRWYDAVTGELVRSEPLHTIVIPVRG